MKAPFGRLSRRHVLIATGLAAGGATNAATGAQPVDADDLAPDALGTGPDGQALRRSDAPNAIHVVCFWATWCGYCKAALPVLEGLQRRLGPDVLRTVLITTEERDVYRRLVRAAKDMQVRFARDAESTVNAAWGSPKGVPHMAVVDTTGMVVGIGSGWGDSSTEWLVRSVNKAIQLRNKALAAPPT